MELRTLDFVTINAADADAGLTVEVVVAPDGQVKSSGRDFTISRAIFETIAAAFKAKGTDLVVDYEHQTLGGDFSSPDGTAPAAGWIKALKYIKGRGIIATVEWTARARELIKAGEYKYLSPVLRLSKSGQPIALHSVAVTNSPAIQGIPALAAKDMVGLNKGVKIMAEGDVAAEGTAPDIGVMIGQILATLGIDMEEGGATDLPTSLKSILAAVKALTSGDSEGGEDGGDGDAVAASIRAVLKLPDDVTTEGVLLAINTLKAGDGSLATMRDEITALKDRVADHDLSKFLQPYRDRGVVGVGPTDADKQLDEKIVLALSASNRDQAKHFLDERVGRLPPPGRDPGKVQDPTKGSRAGMIATAHKEWQDEGRLHVSKLDTYVNGELTENGQPQLTADEKTALSIK